MSEFRFKQFTVCQDRCPMKVGTDGVLLGAWVDLRPADRSVLDIGTGTGLIALMLAQRSSARIVGIDLDSVQQATENAAATPWRDRIDFVQCAVQEFDTPMRFDCIVSNPPFFVDSLTCPDAGRTQARHAVTLPYDALCDAVVRLLAPGGRFSLILPVGEAERFLGVCRGRLYELRRTSVRTTPRRAAKRLLLELTAEPSAESLADELVIGTGEHETYTEEYRALTRDFYLKF